MRSVSEGFRNLTIFTGRMPRRLFWPFAGVVFGVGYLLYMIALFPAVGGVLSVAASSPVPMEAPGAVIAPSAPSPKPNGYLMTTRSTEFPTQIAHDEAVLVSPIISAMLWAVAAFVAILIATLAAAVVRRLHDSGRSGWWGAMPLPFLIIGLVMMPLMMTATLGPEDTGVMLMTLLFANNVIYIAAIIALIVLLVQPSQPHSNQYGDVPTD